VNSNTTLDTMGLNHLTISPPQKCPACTDLYAPHCYLMRTFITF